MNKEGTKNEIPEKKEKMSMFDKMMATFVAAMFIALIIGVYYDIQNSNQAKALCVSEGLIFQDRSNSNGATIVTCIKTERDGTVTPYSYNMEEFNKPDIPVVTCIIESSSVSVGQTLHVSYQVRRGGQ